MLLSAHMNQSKLLMFDDSSTKSPNFSDDLRLWLSSSNVVLFFFSQASEILVEKCMPKSVSINRFPYSSYRAAYIIMVQPPLLPRKSIISRDELEAFISRSIFAKTSATITFVLMPYFSMSGTSALAIELMHITMVCLSSSMKRYSKLFLGKRSSADDQTMDFQKGPSGWNGSLTSVSLPLTMRNFIDTRSLSNEGNNCRKTLVFPMLVHAFPINP